MNNFYTSEECQPLFKPLYLLPTHFIINIPFQQLQILIEEFMDSYDNYTAYDKQFVCEAKYIGQYFNNKNGNYFDFEINIYKEEVFDSKSNCILECNKLCGNEDIIEFRKFYAHLRNYLLPDNYPLDNDFDFTPKPLPEHLIIPLTSADALIALEPIIKFANSNNKYEQGLAAKLFCELTMQEDIIMFLIEFDCISVIFELLMYNYDNLIKTQAIYSILNLLRHKMYKVSDILLNKKYVKNIDYIMEQVTGGSYKTAAFRRGAAEIIEYLASSEPDKFKKCIGLKKINAYIKHTECVEDYDIRGTINDTKNALDL